jgi:hypothetical protein
MSINTPASPVPPPADPRRPGTAPSDARDCIRRLHRDGGISHAIVGLAPAPMHNRTSGRDRRTCAAAVAPLTVPADTVPPARLDAGGTRLRLRALHVMGHNCVRIARALNVGETAIHELIRGDARTVSPHLRDAVADLYDAWWDKRAPERTPYERASATVARRRAIAGNWCAGAALDDDQLDAPGYRPRQGWKPATGTGTAPDIHPSLRRTRRTGHYQR